MFKPTMNTVATAALSAALLLGSPTLQALGQNGRYAIKGAGSQSCESYTHARQADSPQVYMYIGWFQGWLSNENRHAEQTFDLASWQHTATLMAALDQYCKNRPDSLFADAAQALVRAMHPSRLQKDSSMVAAEAEGRSLAVYAEVLKRLQQRLRDKGLLSLRASGRFDAATSDAITHYQLKETIPINGLPDQIVLQMLVHDLKP